MSPGQQLYPKFFVLGAEGGIIPAQAPKKFKLGPEFGPKCIPQVAPPTTLERSEQPHPRVSALLKMVRSSKVQSCQQTDGLLEVFLSLGVEIIGHTPPS
jgi:hypothetical protein